MKRRDFLAASVAAPLAGAIPADEEDKSIITIGYGAHDVASDYRLLISSNSLLLWNAGDGFCSAERMKWLIDRGHQRLIKVVERGDGMGHVYEEVARHTTPQPDSAAYEDDGTVTRFTNTRSASLQMFLAVRTQD